MEGPWHIELLGGLRATRHAQVVARFRTRQTGALLAYLAYHAGRAHPRELLIELHWPGSEPRSGRNRLSQAVSSLRRQLEPPDVPPGAVIEANPTSVQLRPAACTIDVAQFDAALRAARRAGSRIEKEAWLTEAVERYRGELLPGFFDNWILLERQRLAGLYITAQRELVMLREAAGDRAGALEWARRAVSSEPLDEELQQTLIRLLAATGQRETALRQYREFEQRLREELGDEPGEDLRALVAAIERAQSERVLDPTVRSWDGEPSLAERSSAQAEPVSVVRKARSLPSPAGTVTFLLVELDRPSQAHGEVGEASRGALRAWRERLRVVAREHHGHEIDERGDFLQFAFARASEAMATALAGQRAIASLAGVADPAFTGEDFCRGACSPPDPASPHSATAPRVDVRMALHTGEMTLGEDDRTGTEGAASRNGSGPVDREAPNPARQHAARLLRAAHGGQILLSEQTAVLLRDQPDLPTRLLDLGFYRLSHASRQERLFRACRPEGEPPAFPPPKALHVLASHLPLQFTRFFGREKESAQLCGLLLGEAATGSAQATSDIESSAHPIQYPDSRIQNRLVTLTGPGGSGKTRLAQEVAQRVVEPFGGAVCFVPLADLPDARLFWERLVGALHLPRVPEMEPQEQVVTALTSQPALLVLDNLEHLLPEGAAVVQVLRERVATLTVMATSRQRLDLPGEQEFPVGPLPVPVASGQWSAVSKDSDARLITDHGPLTTISECPGVQLFIDRAQAVRPDFQITKANWAAVVELCARQEGLPLAIELAAARIGVLTPAQMLSRMQERFALLARRQPWSRYSPVPDPTRSADTTRHRSLWAALDWSYQLLPPELQRFFAWLSVFRGGFTLEAAEAVCGAGVGYQASGVGEAGSGPMLDTQRPTPALDCLEQLRECSLVQAVDAGGEQRFRMLETLREFGAEQLRAEARPDLERQHACYFLTLAERGDRKLRGPELEEWSARLEAEHDNMRAALSWALAQKEADAALRLSGALSWFWWMRSYLREGQHWLEAALRLPGASARTELRARALCGLGQLTWPQGDFERARAALHESIAIWRELGDKGGLTHALSILGWVEYQAGGRQAAARPVWEESLALCRETGDLWGTAFAAHNLGRSAAAEGDLETALRLHEEAEALFRAQGDPFMLSFPLIGLGHVAVSRGDYAAARCYFEECLAIRDRFDAHLTARANALDNLGLVLWGLGDWPAAAARLEECLDLRRKAGNPRWTGTALFWLGRVRQCAGEPGQALSLLEESLSLFRNSGDRHGEAHVLLWLGRLADEQRQPAAALLREALLLAQSLGDRGTLAAALEEAAALIARRRGAEGWNTAARLRGAAQALRAPAGEGAAVPLPPCEQARHERQATALRQALGDAAFQAARAAGGLLIPEQAASEAVQALGKEADLRTAN